MTALSPKAKKIPIKEKNGSSSTSTVASAGASKDMKAKNPMERIMEILDEYHEGTPPYQTGVDHWGE